MTKSEANFLSAEDLATLDSTVFPLEARPDLVREGPDGRILFSEKGRQFYTAAFRLAGIAVDLPAIRTTKELHAEVLRASAALCAEADAGMRRELDAGRIPVQRRSDGRFAALRGLTWFRLGSVEMPRKSVETAGDQRKADSTLRSSLVAGWSSFQRLERLPVQILCRQCPKNW